MKVFPVKVLLLWCFAMCFLCSSGASQKMHSQIEDLANDYVRKKKNFGLVVGIVDGPISIVKGFGHTDKKKPVPPDGNTVFEIGALSEVFTSSLMVYISMQGGFDLGEPIAGRLPEEIEAPHFHPELCTEVVISPGDTSVAKKGIPRRMVFCQRDPLAEEQYISFFDLATHTSGLPSPSGDLYHWNPFRNISNVDISGRDISKRAFYVALNDYPLASNPGAVFKYSNMGTALLGNLLSDIYGKPYAEMLKAIIADPLHLKDTRVVLNANQLNRKAIGHNIKGKKTQNCQLKAMAGAGGINSTGNDLLKFIRANLNTDNIDLMDAFEQTHQSRVDVYERMAGKSTSAGYGWFISTLNKTSNQSVIWHNGGTIGFRAFMGFVKETQKGVILLSNSSDDVGDLGFDILELLHTKK